jgi:hypothetical protein
MNLLKTLLIAPLAALIAMPVYAHQYDYHGYSHDGRHVEHQHKGHHGKYKKYDRGHHYGWYKKPYYGYRDHGHGYYNHGPRYFDNDGWELILRLSDDF